MIAETAKSLNDHLIELRHAFHSHPEVSGQEKETAARVAAELRTIPGWQVTEQIGGHGVVAVLQGAKPGKTVALRADMDALQITEENDVPYKSQNPGVMHACGHDIHTTALLGAAHLLADQQAQLCGTVRLIFQPAEELSPNGGSRAMIAAGALGDADAVFGFHVWPDLPHGEVGCIAGPLMAASDHFSVTIQGRASHAAKPDEGIDAVVVGAQFINAVQTIISRCTDPLQSAVITVGKFTAGTRYNIVAETCELEGTCRTLNNEVRDFIEAQLQKTLDGICAIYGAKGTLNYERGYMAVVNDAQMTEQARETVEKLFGKQAIHSHEMPSMCAEDFAFYLNEKPGAFLWLGTGIEGETSYPLHNSRFHVDEDILWRGAALLAQLALDVTADGSQEA